MRQMWSLSSCLVVMGMLCGSLAGILDFPSAFADVSITKPYPITINGEKILTVGTGQQTILQLDIENNNDETQPFVAIIEVRDADGVTSDLQFQKGSLPPESSTQIGISWTADTTGNYQVRSFVISDLENPTILSPITVNSLKVAAVTELDVTTKDNDEGSEPRIEDTLTNPNKEQTLQNLRAYALQRINEDRAEFGLPPVELSDNVAAQIHADDVLKTRAISHWMTNGEKPYMTYTRYGGLGYVGQNIGTSGDHSFYENCTSGLYYCQKYDPFEEIDTHQYGMMYEDKECCDDGHRDNILDKHHTHVSIGIAYDDYTFVLVQNFENNYIEFDEPISKDNRQVELSGDIGSGKIYGIYVYYDETPTEKVYQDHKDDMSYDTGELVAGVTTADYYYDDITTIDADKWIESGNSIDIAFDLETAVTKEGVYTIMLILEDKNGSTFPVATYSIWA